ncbi:MAG TPA: PilN domain-containing protein [Candidatus Polarisedimenticolaceae bacterium]|nr:PilN domain-containing protein [Candidatus Polarisedimenticolaceae bacterium]
MIKINLLAEKKQPKPERASTIKVEMGGGQNFLLVGILLVGVVIAGFWWWSASSELEDWKRKHVEADAELQRLEAIRAKGEEYKKKKEELARKIDLITRLKKQQAVPVHILDQISKNLPDFLWLESMSVANNNIVINGKATSYNAVTNFYNNLGDSGYFGSVTLGRVFEVKEGVAFGITCSFAGLKTEPAVLPQN